MRSRLGRVSPEDVAHHAWAAQRCRGYPPEMGWGKLAWSDSRHKEGVLFALGVA